MRAIRHIATVAAIGGLLAAPAVSAASAATSQTAAANTPAAAAVLFKGGTTRLTTAPGVAHALLRNGIVATATWPGRESQRSVKSGPAIQFTFPVTNGRIGLSPLGGNIYHRGGILFVNTKNGKEIAVSNFIINLNHDEVTGMVNGNPKTRVPLFRVSASQATLTAGAHWFTAKGIGLTLTATEASALDAALGTSLFAPGLTLGTAQTLLQV